MRVFKTDSVKMTRDEIIRSIGNEKRVDVGKDGLIISIVKSQNEVFAMIRGEAKEMKEVND